MKFLLKSFVLFTLALLWHCSYFTFYNLENMRDSKEVLVSEAFDLVKKNNPEGLLKLLLSNREHNDMFWKHVGEKFTSDPGMTSQLAFEHMDLETRIVINELLAKFSGSHYNFVGIRCHRAPENYGPFTLHLGCKTTFRDPFSKQTMEINSFRSILEYKGKFKLYHLRRE